MTLPRKPIPARVQTDTTGSVANDWLTLRAPAKLNLFLEVLGRRDDGFHEIETVMAPLGLSDRLWLRSIPDSTEIKLTVGGPFGAAAPTDDRNLAVQAIRSLQKQTGTDLGAEVVLEKNIPAEAGLGGGSSDAAAALLLAAGAWRLDVDHNYLSDVAAGVGSDVPFFLSNGAALCRGRGEQVTPIAGAAGQPCVVIKPPVGLSTAAVYSALSADNGQRSPADPAGIVDSLTKGNWRSVAQQLFNRLQEPAFQIADALKRIASEINASSYFGSLMTGSGSAFFVLTPNHRSARHLAARLRHRAIGSVFPTQIV